MLMLLSVHVSSVLFLVRFNNLALTMGFYWSYTLLLLVTCSYAVLVVSILQHTVTPHSRKEYIIHHPSLSWVTLHNLVAVSVDDTCKTTGIEHLASVELQVALVEALELVKNSSRERRGTDWDESNPDYDIVASQASRAADVQNYPNHRAYI